MKNINSVEHSQCTGCGACFNKCPVDAIRMEYDSDGFLFPVIDQDKCTNCGLCVKSCPAMNPCRRHTAFDTYAVWAKDEIRLQSSSGGMFTLLAEEILSRGGVVCGAIYSDDFLSVYHVVAKNSEELARLRGSKYVQSDTRDTFRETKACLEAGSAVLYVGCPCQIAGLYAFLGRDYDNLYTADLVCHGANSVTAYRSFIREFSEGGEIAKVDFRDKKFFEWSTPQVVYLKNGDVKKAAWNKGMWYKGFLEGVTIREVCANCTYANSSRIADITLGDCWQIHRLDKAYDDRKGTSLVMVNSAKGRVIFERLKSSMKLCRKIPFDFIKQFNPQLIKPSPLHPSRRFFFNHLEKFGFHKALWYGRGMRWDWGIVGWWFASNYGSSLTYYSLGKVLDSLGQSVIFIPIAKTDGNPWEREIQSTVDFIKRHFRVANNRSFDKMTEFNQFVDGFILGSDQMWTVGTLKLVGYTFFLDFADKDKKKIAFSTSFGHNDFIAEDSVIETARDYLERFDALSVREEQGTKIMQNRFGLKADHIIDPIFLCSEKEFDILAEQGKETLPEKYILCYILDPTPEKEKAAEYLSEKMNMPVVTLLGMKEYKYSKDQWHIGTVLPRVGVEDMVKAVKNCTYMMTDSHHGVCMAIIYKRNYAALVNSSRGSSRFETVAGLLGLQQRLFFNALDVCKDDRAMESVDYSSAYCALEREKIKALNWLKEALVLPVKPNKETVNTVRNEKDRIVIGLQNHLRAMNKQKAAEKNNAVQPVMVKKAMKESLNIKIKRSVMERGVFNTLNRMWEKLAIRKSK